MIRRQLVAACCSIELKKGLSAFWKFKSVTNKFIFDPFTYLKEFTSVFIAIIDPNRPSADSKVEPDSEVSWLERHVGAVLLKDHLSIKESTLHGTTVNLFWLNHED